MDRRTRRCLALSILSLLIAAGSAQGAPVTIDFESGTANNEAVTSQFGPPGTPAGPTFKKGTEAGFKGLGCGPPRAPAAPDRAEARCVLLLPGRSLRADGRAATLAPT